MNNDVRFVAHIDILGMSGIVERDFEEAWGVLSDLISVREGIEQLELSVVNSNENIPLSRTIHTATFSDTIILYTIGDSELELRCILIVVLEIFHKALCKCVPVRIGLALGKFRVNLGLSMFAGPALIDAYKVGESSRWLGITLSESVQERAKSLGLKSSCGGDIVVEWPVPIKGGTEPRTVLNWPIAYAHDFTVLPPLKTKLFYEPFRKTFGSFERLDESARDKYCATVDFINHHLPQSPS